MTTPTRPDQHVAAALLWAAVILIGAASPLTGQVADAGYRRGIERWRVERQAALKADDGWLTLVGLFWLQDGANDAGSDPACPVALPGGSAPARIGTFELRGATTTFRPAAGVDVRVNGQPAKAQVVRPQPGDYDVVTAGTLKMFVIQRGPRYGVRVRDTNSPARRAFAGVQWFPIRESYRVTARYVAHETPTTIMIANVLGDLDAWPNPGFVVFTIGEREFRLQAVLDGPDARELFFVFRDLTTGKETYPGGRFLYADMPRNGEVVVDFNKAHSPPCAFTPYATCPLPPKDNALGIRIEAGEKTPHQ